MENIFQIIGNIFSELKDYFILCLGLLILIGSILRWSYFVDIRMSHRVFSLGRLVYNKWGAEGYRVFQIINGIIVTVIGIMLLVSKYTKWF